MSEYQPSRGCDRPRPRFSWRAARDAGARVLLLIGLAAGLGSCGGGSSDLSASPDLPGLPGGAGGVIWQGPVNAWMADIASVIENQKLNEIILPGTHDSGTYDIKETSARAEDGNPHPCDPDGFLVTGSFFKDLWTLVQAIGKSVVLDVIHCDRVQANWSRTQGPDVFAQLAGGIRYIDLRVWNSSGKFYVVHSLVSTDIDTVLDDVKSFYSTQQYNSKEIVILDINHTYGMNTERDADLVAKIKSKLVTDTGVSMLIPRCSDPACGTPTDLTLSKLWATPAQRIIVFYTAPDTSTVMRDNPQLWYNTGANQMIRSNWPNKNSASALVDALRHDANDMDLRGFQQRGGFYVLQGIGTIGGDGAEIKDSVTTTLYREYGQGFGPLFRAFGMCTDCATSVLQWGKQMTASANALRWGDEVFAPHANIIIVDNYSESSIAFKGGDAGYVDTVKQMNKARYCDPWHGPYAPSGSWGSRNDAAGFAIGNLDGNSTPDAVAFYIDTNSGSLASAPSSTGYYRVGKNMNWKNGLASWGEPVAIPGGWAMDTMAGGIALHDLNRDGIDDIVAFEIRSPVYGMVRIDATAYYRVGLSTRKHISVVVPTGCVPVPLMNIKCETIDTEVIFHTWSDPIAVDGWNWDRSQGGGIAIFDINGNGSPDLVTFHIQGEFDSLYYHADATGYSRIGWDLDASGRVTKGWSNPMAIANDADTLAQYPHSTGGGIAIAQIDDNPLPDLVTFHIRGPYDNGSPFGGEKVTDSVAQYRVGFNLNASGTSTSGWTAPMAMDGSWGLPSDDRKAPFGGVAMYDVNRNNRPDLFAFHIEEPPHFPWSSNLQGMAGYFQFALDLTKGGAVPPSACKTTP